MNEALRKKIDDTLKLLESHCKTMQRDHLPALRRALAKDAKESRVVDKFRRFCAKCGIPWEDHPIYGETTFYHEFVEPEFEFTEPGDKEL